MSNRVAKVRISKKLSQEQLAEKAGIIERTYQQLKLGGKKLYQMLLLKNYPLRLRLRYAKFFFLIMLCKNN